MQESLDPVRAHLSCSVHRSTVTGYITGAEGNLPPNPSAFAVVGGLLAASEGR
jgi:hypothetical protein